MFPIILPRTLPLLYGVLVQRYKRFFADVRLDSGEIVTAHCVNTGAMEGLVRPGTPVWVSQSLNPKRKLQFTWELAQVDGLILGVDTSLPNRIVKHLLREGQLPWLTKWDRITPEKRYGERSRVDFWLEGDGHQHYLEVKNCHLVYPDKRAYFPDCVSVRATNHLRELTACLRSGEVTAEVLFFVQIPGVRSVRPSDLHDPVFAEAARRAAKAGVFFSALGVSHTPTAIEVTGPIPVDLKPYGLKAITNYKLRITNGKPLYPSNVGQADNTIRNS